MIELAWVAFFLVASVGIWIVLPDIIMLVLWVISLFKSKTDKGDFQE